MMMNTNPYIGKTLADYSVDEILVAPSLLAADFGHLADELSAIETNGAEVLHYDVMDAHFVPNISMGPPVLSAIRKCTSLLFDVHLMLTNPRMFIAPFAKSGAQHITIHVECQDDIAGTLHDIHAAGCTAGISLKPGTPPEAVLPYLDQVEMLLVMTVEPGFGGQAFMADQLPKIAILHDAIGKSGCRVHLEVDGGIDGVTAQRVKQAGANVLVAGSSVFRNPAGVAEAIRALRA